MKQEENSLHSRSLSEHFVLFQIPIRQTTEVFYSSKYEQRINHLLSKALSATVTEALCFQTARSHRFTVQTKFLGSTCSQGAKFRNVVQQKEIQFSGGTQFVLHTTGICAKTFGLLITECNSLLYLCKVF